MSMIVYAHEYTDHDTSWEDYKRFRHWSETHLPHEVSQWRTRDALDETRWFVIVVDESHDSGSLGFDWRGKPYDLDRQQALSFAMRRNEAKVGRAPTDVHYGVKIAPRIRPDGRWEIPWPGQG